jgi:hypothetical protein
MRVPLQETLEYGREQQAATVAAKPGAVRRSVLVLAGRGSLDLAAAQLIAEAIRLNLGIDARCASLGGLDAIAKAEQFAHWEFYKDSKDPAVFARFLKMFPTGSFTALARSQLGKLAAEAWQKLGESEDIPALQDFVRLFGDDVRAVEAQDRIDALDARAAEAESWARVKDSVDLAGVEAHVARFPGGVNAAAAGALLLHLRRERDAAERWRAIADVSEPEAFEQFLVAYADSAVARQARARLDEIRRAREEQDWTAVRDARHPAPLLRFLRTHPDGVRAAEASELLVSLERTVEQEAWTEVKDSDQPIVFRAYLAALPRGRNAKAARARLQMLAAREGATAASAAVALAPPAVAAPVSAAAAPVFFEAAPTSVAAQAQVPLRTPGRRKRIVFLALMGFLVMGFLVVFSTFRAIDGMSNPTGKLDVSNFLLLAAISLALIVLPLYFLGPSLYPNVMESADGRSILFHALGSMTIMLWIMLTQSVAESYHRVWDGNIDNVAVGKWLGSAILLVVVLIAASVALRAQKSPRWRWLRFAWYGLVSVIGLFYFFSHVNLLDGLVARDYWVTTCVNVFGGTLLVLLSAAIILSRVVAWREAARATAPAS